MDLIWTSSQKYQRAAYKLESELEAAIVQLQHELFGPARYYLDVKKKIGGKLGFSNIPDGYLLDLAGHKPRLFVVENELASHDPLKHVAVQILKFSLSFETDQITVKRVLAQAIADLPAVQKAVAKYANEHGYASVDGLLEYVAFDAEFAALVIIDELYPALESILAKKFRFGVEVLELGRYVSAAGEYIYQFEPFLSDLQEETANPLENIAPADPSALDTLIVPAQEGGFEDVFLGENRWYAVRVHGSMRSQIKYVAAYQVAPISAITFVAPVKSIEPWKDSGKMVINFAEPARQVGPITLAKSGKIRAPQSPRYAVYDRLLKANTLDELW